MHVSSTNSDAAPDHFASSDGGADPVSNSNAYGVSDSVTYGSPVHHVFADSIPVSDIVADCRADGRTDSVPDDVYAD